MRVGTSAETASEPESQPRHAHNTQHNVGGTAIPPAGHNGHGIWACLRRQPVRMVHGRAEGGYTDRFEVICPDCGDHPRQGYTEVGRRLQSLRGPYTLNEGLAAYERHIGAN